MITDSELDDIRAVREENMPETVYVQNLATNPDSGGGDTGVWQTTSIVNGRIGSVGKSAEEKEIASRMSNVIGYTVFLPSETVIDETCQLQINSRQFQILGIVRKSHNTALRVVCIEVK
ncbi:MAG: hypothetical protein CVU46_11065 [Chloroflexi bacterium HGW-Chloroflexi-8]|jgi:hypothetical protein|nr:MAG: hypothetical protein CVU46_11065 [Chloroflexi bacterium HGW-Chloroflexi-8]